VVRSYLDEPEEVLGVQERRRVLRSRPLAGYRLVAFDSEFDDGLGADERLQGCECGREVVRPGTADLVVRDVRRVDEVEFAVGYEDVLPAEVAVRDAVLVHRRQRLEQRGRVPFDLLGRKFVQRLEIREVLQDQHAEAVHFERLHGLRRVHAQVAELPRRFQFVFGHLHGAVEGLEEPLAAARERAEVPSAREQRVHERVLPRDDFHEPAVVDDAGRRQPVVRLQERHAHRLLVVAVGDFPRDGFQGFPRDRPTDQLADAHSGHWLPPVIGPAAPPGPSRRLVDRFSETYQYDNVSVFQGAL